MLQEAGQKAGIWYWQRPTHPGSIFVGHKGASGFRCADVILNDNRDWLQGGILLLIDIDSTALPTLPGAIFVGHKGASAIHCACVTCRQQSEGEVSFFHNRVTELCVSW